jgi:hypothetical protein
VIGNPKKYVIIIPVIVPPARNGIWRFIAVFVVWSKEYKQRYTTKLIIESDGPDVKVSALLSVQIKVKTKHKANDEHLKVESTRNNPAHQLPVFSVWVFDYRYI